MNNFKLRKWEIDDIKSIEKYANNKNVADNLRNIFPYPYTLEDAEDYVRFCIKGDKKKQCCRAVTVNGEAVGSIGVFIKDDVYCKTAEVGYWLGEEFWGKGIMSKAIKEICEFVFDNYDIVRIFAEPFACNMGSKRALEKADFKLEGILEKSVYKNGVIGDSCIYGLINNKL